MSFCSVMPQLKAILLVSSLELKQQNIEVPLIEWISDTLSQGYTNLQSLVKCLDHRVIASDTVCSQARLC